MASPLNSSGALRASPEQVIRTPSVIAIISVIFAAFLVVGFGMAVYWHELEAAKKLHPNSVGYGKWYFSLIPRIWVTIGLSVLLVVLVIIAIAVVFWMPGPMLAEAYLRDHDKAQTSKVLKSLETEDLALAASRVQQYRTARRQAGPADAYGSSQEMTSL